MYNAILHFIEMKNNSEFPIKEEELWEKRNSKTLFWKMIEIDQDVWNWINVIDQMEKDKYCKMYSNNIQDIIMYREKLEKPKVRAAKSSKKVTVTINNKQKYVINTIYNSPMFSVIEYYFKLLEERGYDMNYYYDTNKWWNERGQKTNFWKLVKFWEEDNSKDADYWKFVIDDLFNNFTYLKEKFDFNIYGIILYSKRVPFSYVNIISVIPEDIKNECEIRTGVSKGEVNKKLDKLFREDGLPTQETLIQHGLEKDFRFKTKLIKSGIKIYW